MLSRDQDHDIGVMRPSNPVPMRQGAACGNMGVYGSVQVALKLIDPDDPVMVFALGVPLMIT